MTDRYAPPRSEAPLADRIRALRAKGWSVKSIVRHLSVPEDAVRSALGVASYAPDGRVRIPVIEVVK